ncbi:MAG TPA: hypothetical protein VGG89_09270 [Candidatus Baltobacteraceae bacterium]
MPALPRADDVERRVFERKFFGAAGDVRRRNARFAVDAARFIDHRLRRI